MEDHDEPSFLAIKTATGTHNLNVKFIKYLGTLKNMVEDLQPDDDSKCMELAMDRLDLPTLRLVDEFCFLCELQGVPCEKLIASDWGVTFLIDHGDHFANIVEIADFLEFRVLYDTCKLYFKVMVKTMTDQDLRDRFKLVNDLTAEEKKKVCTIGAYVLKVK